MNASAMARDSVPTRSTRARQPSSGRGGGAWVWIAASMAVVVISAVAYWFWKRRQDLRETTPKPPKDPKPPVEKDPVHEDPVEEDPVEEDPVHEDPVHEDPDGPPQDDRYRTCATPYQTLNADGQTCTATCLDEYGQIQPKLANGTCPLVLGRASDALVQAQIPLKCPFDSQQPSQQFIGLCQERKYTPGSPPLVAPKTCRDDQWKMTKSYTFIVEDPRMPVDILFDVCVGCAPDAVQDVDNPQQCRPVVCPPNSTWDEAKRGCQPNDQIKAIVREKPPVVCPYGSYETKDGRCYAYCRDAKNQLQPHQSITIKDGRSINVCPSIGVGQVTEDPLCPIGSRLFGKLCIPQYVNKV